jgi:hypothetical protein
MIGYDPIVDNMVIIDQQDFSHFFGVDGDPFPAGTTVTVKIFSRDGDQLGAWPAVTVQSSGALVQITSDDLAPVSDACTFKVFVQYPDSADMCWYRGRVWRRT